jgi:hypothetical protein
MKLVKTKYKPEDLGYAAALVDGEGCIGVYSNKNVSLTYGRTHRLMVQIGMSDKEPVEFMFKTFGGFYNAYKAHNMGDRLRYNWAISTRQARDFLVFILPYLKGKVEQAKLAVEFQNQIRKKSGGVLKPLTIEELKSRDEYVVKMKELKRI